MTHHSLQQLCKWYPLPGQPCFDGKRDGCVGKYLKGGAVLSGDLQSVPHVTLKLSHAYFITHVIYPVSPRLCLPPAVPLTAIEITTVNPKGSLPTILLCEPVFKRFSDQPLGRTDAFVQVTIVLSPPRLPP